MRAKQIFSSLFISKDIMKSRFPLEHEEYNSKNYPGTRQLCINCELPTERCGEDSLFEGDTGPLCEDCLDDISLKTSNILLPATCPKCEIDPNIDFEEEKKRFSLFKVDAQPKAWYVHCSKCKFRSDAKENVKAAILDWNFICRE